MNPADDCDVQVGETNGPLDASPTWVTEPKVRSIVSTRGRGLEYGPYSSGTCTVTVDNLDGSLDPLHSDKLRPGRPFRWRANVSGTPVVMFTGVITSARAVYRYPGGSSVVISAAHPLTLLARYPAPGTQGGARTHEAIDAVLDAVGWPSGRRVLSGAGHRGQRVPPAWITTTAPSVSIIDELVASEGPLAAFFVTRDGDLRFDGKGSPAQLDSLITAQITLSNLAADTTLLRYRGTPLIDESVLYPRASVSNSETGVTVEASDAGAVLNHGNLTVSWSGRYASDNYAQSDADLLVSMFSTPRARLTPITVTPVDDGAEFTKLAELEIRDRIGVKHETPAGQNTVADQIVEQISTNVTAGDEGSRWVTTLIASPAARIDDLNADQWMIVGDLDTGRVGTGLVAP